MINSKLGESGSFKICYITSTLAVNLGLCRNSRRMVKMDLVERTSKSVILQSGSMADSAHYYPVGSVLLRGNSRLTTWKNIGYNVRRKL